MRSFWNREELSVYHHYKSNKRLPSSLTRASSCKLEIESMKSKQETYYYRNIYYCDFDARGMCRQGKERNRIGNRIGNRIRKNLNLKFFLFFKF